MTPTALFLGVDGGGTGCRARLADADGRRLGEGAGAAANITTDLPGSLVSIDQAVSAAFAAAGLGPADYGRTRVAFGMAGGNAPAAAAGLSAHPFPFASVTVTSDAETACLGAHAGADGAILILGTGSQGYGRRDGAVYRVGGWGFALSDDGSGAVIGHRAVRRALAALEGLAPASAFTRAITGRFADRPEDMLAWAIEARPKHWAEFAPVIFEHAAEGDPVAQALRADAVLAVEALLARLAGLGAERIALVGGLAPLYAPLITDSAGSLLVAPAGDALEGALRLAGLAAQTARDPR